MAGYTSAVVCVFLIFNELLGSAGGAAAADEAAGSLRRGVSGRTLSASDGRQEGTGRHTLTLKAEQAHRQLIICNAYTSKHGLDVVQVRTKDRVTGSPLSYKQCREFVVPLEEGDQLDFKSGDLFVGTFYANGLPKSSASLLLVPHRREPHSASVTFESHAFSEMQNPQIAVVDAYKGHQSGSVRIIESHEAPNNAAADAAEDLEEDLNFNSVVAVNPGKYKVSLISDGQKSLMPLSTKDKATYVILRVGNDAAEKSKTNDFAQELVVFPNNGAPRMSQISLLALVAMTSSVLLGVTV